MLLLHVKKSMHIDQQSLAYKREFATVSTTDIAKKTVNAFSAYTN